MMRTHTTRLFTVEGSRTTFRVYGLYIVIWKKGVVGEDEEVVQDN